MSFVEHRRCCLAYSPGGHFAELQRALEGIELADCFHVTFASDGPLRAGENRQYYVSHPRRRLWHTLKNAWESWRILRLERPELVISTGADVAVPVFILGRLIGAHCIFIETGGSMRPTLAGRICYPFAHLFIVQWKERKRAFPKAMLAEGLLL